MNESDALRVLALREIESAQPPSPALWSAADRDWATRAALDQAGQEASAQRFLVERATLASQRLGPRLPELQRWIERRGWRGTWSAWVLGGALVAGLAVDSLGGARHINLLAPPLWGVMAWNLLVYVLLIVRLPRWKQAAPAGWLLDRVRAAFGTAPAGQATALHALAPVWARASAPQNLARAAALLHGLAAALALGLIAGLYLRGLVFDYRAGWQSTFLDAPQVHAVLSFVLAPASRLSGIALPDTAAFDALRLGAAPPEASAAAWIHLLAVSLALWVVLPRLALSLANGWRARHLAANVELPLHEPYFQRLLREQRGEVARVQVVPYAQAPSALACAALSSLLAQVLGNHVHVSVSPTIAYGAEDDSLPTDLLPPGTTHALLLCDLAATPDAEHHGRFGTRLATEAASRGTTALLCLDQAVFVRRFAHLPQRLAERRAAWQGLAESAGLPLAVLCLDPAYAESPEGAPSAAALRAAFDAAAGPRGPAVTARFSP